MSYLLIWLGFGVVTALAASARGHNPWLWLFIGCVFGFFGLLAVLVIKPNEATATNTAQIPVAPSDRPGDLAQHYQGYEIRHGYSGFIVDDRRFKSIDDAQEYIAGEILRKSSASITD
jgi:hypothetical protein